MNKQKNSNPKSKRRLNHSKRNPVNRSKEKFTDETFRAAAKSEAKGNDASYYNHNPNLLQIAGKFSFANAIGMYTKFGNDKIAASSGVDDYESLYKVLDGTTPAKAVRGMNRSVIDVPGIMTLEVSLVPGFSSGYESPVNIAARNIYTATRAMQTSTFQFDPADEMLFCITMDNINCFYVWMQRLYGIMNNYEVLNRYVPDALIKANHVDPNDLRKHKADLLYYMEQYAVYARSYPIPTEMMYFKRHAEMFANVYKDGEGDKAQLYMFVPSGFWSFNETFSTAEKGACHFNALTETSSSTIFKLLKFEDIVALGDKLLMGVISSQDAGNISAALIKAFGYDSYSFGSTDWQYVVKPVYNEEILMQIHNAKTVGLFSSNSNITQDDEGQVIFAPVVAIRENTEVMVDCAYNDPTPEEVMAMTRFCAIVTNTSTGSTAIGVAGAEIVNSIYMFKIFHSNTSSSQEEPILGYLLGSDTIQLTSPNMTANEVIRFVERLSDVSKFDWSPLMEISSYSSEGGKTYGARIVFNDFENYTVLTPENLRKLHETALLSLFGVPRN